MATPQSTVTCDDVCAVVTKCGVSATVCSSVCPKLALGCKGCLVKTTDCGSECNTVCGVVTDPAKSKHDPTPAVGKNCDALTYLVATGERNAAGGNDAAPCTTPSECRSGLCISGLLGMTTATTRATNVSFCASFSPCNEPDASGSPYACPTGWKCGEVAQNAAQGAATYWSCVPPDANPCKAGELVYK